MAEQTTLPHVETARAAGLDYVTDAEPGISRKRVGRGWAYYEPNGALIRDRAERRRLNALAVPPAWTEVWICPDPNGHLQVTARDKKGRKQYRYHPRFREKRDESKFGRMLAFSEVLPRVRERVERDLVAYAKHNRSFGLTTLRRRHVQVKGAKLRFEFRGKSGVMRTAAITDRRIARIVQSCRELPGLELFKYLDDEGRRHRRTRRHGQGLSHLGGHDPGHHRAEPARSGRFGASGQQERGAGDRRGSSSPGKHAGGVPQVLRAPRDHRGLREGRGDAPAPASSTRREGQALRDLRGLA
jgi:DNA topoisomerase IB